MCFFASIYGTINFFKLVLQKYILILEKSWKNTRSLMVLKYWLPWSFLTAKNGVLFHFSYVKKLLEDCNNSEDTTKMLKFCSWENPHFSSTVLSELLWQVAYSYTYELRPYLDLLLQMLLLEDSWQNHRIHNALKGRTIRVPSLPCGDTG